MNDYVTLDGKKYATLARSWRPRVTRPVQTSKCWSGRTSVTFGPPSSPMWAGEVACRVTPLTGYGSISDLRTAYEKRTALTFIDHYGNSHSVALLGDFDEASVMNVWDAPSNEFRIMVQMVGL